VLHIPNSPRLTIPDCMTFFNSSSGEMSGSSVTVALLLLTALAVVVVNSVVEVLVAVVVVGLAGLVLSIVALTAAGGVLLKIDALLSVLLTPAVGIAAVVVGNTTGELSTVVELDVAVGKENAVVCCCRIASVLFVVSNEAVVA